MNGQSINQQIYEFSGIAKKGFAESDTAGDLRMDAKRDPADYLEHGRPPAGYLR